MIGSHHLIACPKRAETTAHLTLDNWIIYQMIRFSSSDCSRPAAPAAIVRHAVAVPKLSITSPSRRPWLDDINTPASPELPSMVSRKMSPLTLIWGTLTTLLHLWQSTHGLAGLLHHPPYHQTPPMATAYHCVKGRPMTRIGLVSRTRGRAGGGGGVPL
jgi:hypothetical protein